jgi:hypothetical protein
VEQQADQRFASAEDGWWASWWAHDYSWANLKKHRVGAGGNFHVHGKARDLEAFWRLDQNGAALRTDIQMGSELVTDRNGRVWHKAHVPLRWEDDTPAKCAWNAEELEELRHLVKRQMSAFQASTAHLSNPQVCDLSGVIAPIEMPSEINIWMIDTYVIGTCTLKHVMPRSRVMRCFFQGQLTMIDSRFEVDPAFEECVFSGRLCVLSSRFEGGCSFHSSVFGGESLIERSDFAKEVDFTSVEFRGSISFSSSKFRDEVKFLGTKFRGNADFLHTDFYDRVSFSGAEYHGPVSFSGATFLRGVDFTDILWVYDETAGPIYKRTFHNCAFEGPAKFLQASWRHFSAFDGAIFRGGVHLDDLRERTARARFNEELSEACKQAETRDDDVSALMGGLQILRRALEQASDKRGSYLLHEFELASRVHRSDSVRSEVFLSRIYRAFSNYGSSIARPLVWLIGLTCALGVFYAAVGAFSQGEWSLHRPFAVREIEAQPFFSGLNHSLSRMFPLPVAGAEQSAFRQAIVGQEGTFHHLAILFLGVVQSLLSATLSYLFAMAVRRRFQIG